MSVCKTIFPNLVKVNSTNAYMCFVQNQNHGADLSFTFFNGLNIKIETDADYAYITASDSSTPYTIYYESSFNSPNFNDTSTYQTYTDSQKIPFLYNGTLFNYIGVHEPKYGTLSNSCAIRGLGIPTVILTGDGTVTWSASIGAQSTYVTRDVSINGSTQTAVYGGPVGPGSNSLTINYYDPTATYTLVQTNDSISTVPVHEILYPIAATKKTTTPTQPIPIPAVPERPNLPESVTATTAPSQFVVDGSGTIYERGSDNTLNVIDGDKIVTIDADEIVSSLGYYDLITDCTGDVYVLVQNMTTSTSNLYSINQTTLHKVATNLNQCAFFNNTVMTTNDPQNFPQDALENTPLSRGAFCGPNILLIHTDDNSSIKIYSVFKDGSFAIDIPINDGEMPFADCNGNVYSWDPSSGNISRYNALDNPMYAPCSTYSDCEKYGSGFYCDTTSGACAISSQSVMYVENITDIYTQQSGGTPIYNSPLSTVYYTSFFNPYDGSDFVQQVTLGVDMYDSGTQLYNDPNPVLYCATDADCTGGKKCRTMNDPHFNGWKMSYTYVDGSTITITMLDGSTNTRTGSQPLFSIYDLTSQQEYGPYSVREPNFAFPPNLGVTKIDDTTYTLTKDNIPQVNFVIESAGPDLSTRQVCIPSQWDTLNTLVSLSDSSLYAIQEYVGKIQSPKVITTLNENNSLKAIQTRPHFQCDCRKNIYFRDPSGTLYAFDNKTGQVYTADEIYTDSSAFLFGSSDGYVNVYQSGTVYTYYIQYTIDPDTNKLVSIDFTCIDKKGTQLLDEMNNPIQLNGTEYVYGDYYSMLYVIDKNFIHMYQFTNDGKISDSWHNKIDGTDFYVNATGNVYYRFNGTYNKIDLYNSTYEPSGNEFSFMVKKVGLALVLFIVALVLVIMFTK